VPTSFFICKILPKTKTKNSKKICDFESFHSPKVRKKIVKMLDFYIWFSVCSQKYRRMINAIHKLLIEIWPNIPRGDHPFFSTSSYGRSPLWLKKKISFKKTLVHTTHLVI
jgi:hypothetical protein